MAEASIDITVLSGFLRGLKPEPIISVSEWADSKRILPQSSAAPGPFRTDKTPYIREIADKLSVNDPAQTLIFMKSSQVAGTEMGNNWLGYTIDLAPAPFLYMMPTDALVKSTSKKRIQPMIDTTPSIKSKIKPSRAKDSGNTILEKYYEGGSVTLVGANSPVGLSSNAVRYVYGDEIDRMPLDVAGEGSPVDLATTRTMTFGARRKVLLTSTPTRKGQSLIATEFEKTGERYYHVPCPFCGAAQQLVFEQLRYEKGKYEQTKYECAHCQELIPERFKPKMLAEGLWVAKFPEREDGVTFGYHISALYSPLGWYSWGQMAKEYEDSTGNIPKRITWINTKKGQCYEHEGDSPQWELLYAQRQSYQRNTCRAKVAFITAGVDVQADRLELEIVGWIKGKQSQSIDYRTIQGDTSAKDVWDKLEGLLQETFVREDGAQLQIATMAIDTGYNTSFVYEFCQRPTVAGRVVPVKGKDDMATIFSAPRPVQVTRQGQKINGVKVFHVGVSLIKSEIYGWLKQVRSGDDEAPYGYCHFPQYDESYFRGLTAEKLETKTNKKGFPAMQWVKHYKRNEPLDCRVYARAAASIMGMDIMQDSYWDGLLQNAEKHVRAAAKKSPKKKSSFWK